MPDFTIAPDSDLWHEVPGAHAGEQFITDHTRGLSGDDAAVAGAVAEAALAARQAADDLTIMLHEPSSSLYAIASFALYSDRAGVASEKEALQLVTGGQFGAWEPVVVEVKLGPVRGYRDSFRSRTTLYQTRRSPTCR